MFLDMNYMVMVALPAMILSGVASFLTKSTFKKYSRVPSASRVTGAEAASRLLERNGVRDVKIEPVQGFLSDHYDPRSKTLRLSPDVYQSPSLSAIGVACHEAGHALQHARHYAPLHLRSLLVPVTSFGSKLAMPLIIGGILLGSASKIGSPGISQALLLSGIALFALTVVFSVVTLPVEWDASARAKRLMVSSGIVTDREQAHAAKVLNAAFLTYLASAISAILTLLYYLWRAGLIGGRR